MLVDSLQMRAEVLHRENVAPRSWIDQGWRDRRLGHRDRGLAAATARDEQREQEPGSASEHGLGLRDAGDVLAGVVEEVGLDDDRAAAAMERPRASLDRPGAHGREEVRLRLDRRGRGGALGQVEVGAESADGVREPHQDAAVQQPARGRQVLLPGDASAHLLGRCLEQFDPERLRVRHRRPHLLGERRVHGAEPTKRGMQPSPAAADARTVIRLLAMIAAGAFVLSGCSTLEARHAQELLQDAERAQAQLTSAAFEVDVSFALDGQQVELALQGAASKEGATFAIQSSGIPEASDQDLEVVVRDGRAWTREGDTWESVPVPGQMKTQVGGLSGSMGAGAFQSLARHVRDVRVAENQQIGGKIVTTIAGEIDTAELLRAVTELGSASGKGEPALPFDLDDLGLKIGDIKAVLSIDERTHLLDNALVTLSIEAQGKTLEFELRYRLTSANEPVELPSPPA